MTRREKAIFGRSIGGQLIGYGASPVQELRAFSSCAHKLHGKFSPLKHPLAQFVDFGRGEFRDQLQRLEPKTGSPLNIWAERVKPSAKLGLLVVFVPEKSNRPQKIHV